MLNNEALTELSKLKKIIADSKDTGEGIVRGSQGRYGFVNLDDGRSVYLPAEAMQRVLPGDRVAVEVINNDKNKQEAKLEKLLQKNFNRFVGSYTIKGNNHFVMPDHKETNRGLFVPPKERKSFAEGDFVQCDLTRHPFTDGKSQVKIITPIGKRDDAGIEHHFIQHKYPLNNQFHPDTEREADSLSQIAIESIASGREDLSELPLVTIDAANTEDLDDALFAETTAEGWNLYSAIADPDAFVQKGSVLDKLAREKASSVYFPGKVLPMFPHKLTTDTFSLAAQRQRPALVCKISINVNGEIRGWEFFTAVIQSHGKLSYEQVASYLDKKAKVSLEDNIQTSLSNLADLAKARRIYRQQHCIVQDDNIDYRYRMDDKLQIEGVDIRTGTSAHRIVEEAMLATNCCAGEELAKQNCSAALFSCHGGFRKERLQEIQHLLKLERPDYQSDDITTLAGYKRLFQTLSHNQQDQQLLWTLRRLLQGAELATEAKPHFGLGFDRYALITSPIRRYQDLHNQRLIKHHLHQTDPHPANSEAEITLGQELQEQISKIRAAQRELDQRLLCRFLAKDEGNKFKAKIVAISSQGLALRLLENGAESFLPLRNGPKLKVKYDSVRLSLTVNETCFNIEQQLLITLEKVNLEKYQLRLALSQSI